MLTQYPTEGVSNLPPSLAYSNLQNTMKTMYIFGYGSLMNPISLQKTLPGKRQLQGSFLVGYQRKINVPVNGYLYLNIIPNPRMKVRGIAVEINLLELKYLKRREAGYQCIDVSGSIEGWSGKPIFAFIAPDKAYPGMKIPRSYLDTCLRGVPRSDREVWIKETIIENEIEEDLAKPVYANAAIK